MFLQCFWGWLTSASNYFRWSPSIGLAMQSLRYIYRLSLLPHIKVWLTSRNTIKKIDRQESGNRGNIWWCHFISLQITQSIISSHLILPMRPTFPSIIPATRPTFRSIIGLLESHHRHSNFKHGLQLHNLNKIDEVPTRRTSWGGTSWHLPWGAMESDVIFTLRVCSLLFT